MEPTSFREPSGRLVQVEPREGGRRPFWAFVPALLPPENERAAVLASVTLLAEAEHALGKLEGLGILLPNPDLLIQPYIRREAVLSSRIEGTQTSFTDLIAYEAGATVGDRTDAREVFNYVQALEFGLRHVADSGVTPDLVRTMHRQLLQGVRGEAFGMPGQFRLHQNQIGAHDPADARFVPPPPAELGDLLDNLFAYLRVGDHEVPFLVRAAWAHYQFETIHPFLDGNGRVGRLMIPLLLASHRRLSHPLLYLSPYFEANRSEYYDRLLAVSAESDWVGWLRFFLEGVERQAQSAVALSQEIIKLGVDWRARLDVIGAPVTANRLAEYVHQHRWVDGPEVARALDVSAPTAYKAISILEDAGILMERTGRKRGKIYLAMELVRLLSDAV